MHHLLSSDNLAFIIDKQAHVIFLTILFDINIWRSKDSVLPARPANSLYIWIVNRHHIIRYIFIFKLWKEWCQLYLRK